MFGESRTNWRNITMISLEFHTISYIHLADLEPEKKPETIVWNIFEEATM